MLSRSAKGLGHNAFFFFQRKEGLNAFKKPNVANRPREPPAQHSQPRSPPSGGRADSRAGLSETTGGWMAFSSSCCVLLDGDMVEPDILVSVLHGLQ